MSHKQSEGIDKPATAVRRSTSAQVERHSRNPGTLDAWLEAWEAERVAWQTTISREEQVERRNRG